MIVKFCKMQSLGNDFIMINMEQFAKIKESFVADLLNAKFFRKISSRHFGIGADQVVLYRFNSKTKSAQVKFFNPDGTEAEICGNAVRCLGFLIFREVDEEKSIMFAGERPFEVFVAAKSEKNDGDKSNTSGNANKIEATVLWDSNVKIESLSEAVFNDLSKICRDYKVEIDKAYSVNVGNPHLVLFLKNMPSKNTVKKLGEKLENHAAFAPQKTNVGFAVKYEEKKGNDKNTVLNLNVFERGAGPTLGCGSGAMAAAIVAKKFGIISKSSSEILVRQRGGDLRMIFDEKGGLWQKGDVEYLFKGEVSSGDEVEVEENESILANTSSEAKVLEKNQQDISKTKISPKFEYEPTKNVEELAVKSNFEEENHSESQQLSRVVIYTDGACSGNPGPGGWGVLIIEDGKEREMFGGEADTTNNRMELTAVIKALESVPKNCEIELYTDSQYVKNGITQWIKTWVRNNWKNSDRKPVKNQDLWRKLLAQTLVLQSNDGEPRRKEQLEVNGNSSSPFLSAYISRPISWKWVKGHNNDLNNERVDKLARRGCKEVTD